MLSLLFGSFGFWRLLSGPLAILAAVGTIFALCGCMRCMSCKLRECSCIKRLLRVTGQDEFDDFELMILVHEASIEHKDHKLPMMVRVTAGTNIVSTDAVSNGIFQTPLHVHVDQGTTEIVIALLDARSRNGDVLATLSLDPVEYILSSQSLQPETSYPLSVKQKGVRNPSVKLTMVVVEADDADLTGGCNLGSDVDILVRQQLRKAKEQGKGINGVDGDLSEMEVLKQACSGPLDMFEGLGKHRRIYVSVQGPPTSRRWVLGVWTDQTEFTSGERNFKEVDLLKIKSVQADPTRDEVFFVNYFNESKQENQLIFRRVDRARDVWVEILHIFVGKARDAKKTLRLPTKGSGSPSMRQTSRGRSETSSSSFSRG